MTQQQAEELTGLDARVVDSESISSPHIRQIGDRIRYQLGRKRSSKVRFTERDDNGKTITHSVTGDFFHLVAFGPTFYDAVAMHRRQLASKVISIHGRRAA